MKNTKTVKTFNNTDLLDEWRIRIITNIIAIKSKINPLDLKEKSLIFFDYYPLIGRERSYHGKVLLLKKHSVIIEIGLIDPPPITLFGIRKKRCFFKRMNIIQESSPESYPEITFDQMNALANDGCDYRDEHGPRY